MGFHPVPDLQLLIGDRVTNYRMPTIYSSEHICRTLSTTWRGLRKLSAGLQQVLTIWAELSLLAASL